MFHVEMEMIHHGSLEMEIAFALIILFQKKNQMCLQIPTTCHPEGKEDSNDNISKGASSVARFERAKCRCKMALEQQRLQEEEVTSQRLYLSHIYKAFKHDHGSLFKYSKEDNNTICLWLANYFQL